MGQLLRMHTETTNFKLEGGYLFTSMEKVSDIMLDIYSIAMKLDSKETVTIECNFSFVDVRVKRLLLKFFKGFGKLHAQDAKCSIHIIWKYDFEDEDIEEFGEILVELANLPIHSIQIDRTDEYALAAN